MIFVASSRGAAAGGVSKDEAIGGLGGPRPYFIVGMM
jgi:hypothetical protein